MGSLIGDGHVAWWLAVAIGFAVSFVAAPAGVSGAFLLLPIQVSVVGVVAPSATATNLLYNVLATPGGILTYVRQGRLDLALARWIVAGTVPGVIVGAYLRTRYLADPDRFKVFVGVVLLGLAVRLVTRPAPNGGADAGTDRSSAARPGPLLALSLVVGVVGGIYGIGGGAIIAPFLVTVMGLSVYRVAGAALLATFVTSAVGVAVYQLFGALGVTHPAAPDWRLGVLFGLGGFVGSILGARLQPRLPERLIGLMLAGFVSVTALAYLVTGVTALTAGP